MSPVEGQTTDKTIKSHKMIILALDYKFTENGTWVPIPIQQYSGSFVEQPEQTDAGILMSAEVTAYMPVQPHECGERGGTFTRINQNRGSAPRVWGTSRQWGGKILIYRFSPTSVGNVDTSNTIKCEASVQPHECGERVIQGF